MNDNTASANISRAASIVALAFTFAACTSQSDLSDRPTPPRDTSAHPVVKADDLIKQVEARLFVEPGYADVTVDAAQDGVIVLSGSTGSEADKARADSIAREVPGVTRVEMSIGVTRSDM